MGISIKKLILEILHEWSTVEFTISLSGNEDLNFLGSTRKSTSSINLSKNKEFSSDIF